MAKKVLVFADIRRGKLRNVTLEMLGAAVTASDGGEIAVLLVGKDVSGFANGLGDAGADHVFVVDAPELAHYTPGAYKKAFMAAYQAFAPDVIFFSHSAVGKDLAPTVAMRIGAGQVSDAVALAVEAGTLTFHRPIYAGKAFTKVQITDGAIVATIRPNNIAPVEASQGKPGTLKTLEVSFEAQDLSSMVQIIR